MEFSEKVSGCTKHTKTLSYVINHARKNQRNLVITLLDLKNAFGEVDHELDIYASTYAVFFISFATDEYLTPPITVKKGVLQGDSLSLLFFHLVITLTLLSKRKNCIGYIYDGYIQLKHWLQFEDDTSIVTALETNNQYLVNAFTKWSSWAGLFIRVDICSTFGIKKVVTDSAQDESYLKIANERILSIEMNNSFTYLGK